MPEPRKNLNPLTVVIAAALFILVVLVIAGGRESPSSITKAKLEVLRDAVITFHADTGHPPASLDELALAPEQLQDHLGEPIRYELIDGTAILISYGSDKEPGGMFFKRDHVLAFDLP